MTSQETRSANRALACLLHVDHVDRLERAEVWVLCEYSCAVA
jgi:hypothetical protein